MFKKNFLLFTLCQLLALAEDKIMQKAPKRCKKRRKMIQKQTPKRCKKRPQNHAKKRPQNDANTKVTIVFGLF